MSGTRIREMNGIECTYRLHKYADIEFCRLFFSVRQATDKNNKRPVNIRDPNTCPKGSDIEIKILEDCSKAIKDTQPCINGAHYLDGSVIMLPPGSCRR